MGPWQKPNLIDCNKCESAREYSSMDAFGSLGFGCMIAVVSAVTLVNIGFLSLFFCASLFPLSFTRYTIFKQFQFVFCIILVRLLYISSFFFIVVLVVFCCSFSGCHCVLCSRQLPFTLPPPPSRHSMLAKIEKEKFDSTHEQTCSKISHWYNMCLLLGYQQ